MKTFSHKRPIRNELGEVTGQKPAPVFRVTREQLGGQFGPDKNRRLVVGLLDGDVITLRPEKTRQALTITAVDLYRFAIRCKAQRASLEKATKVKAKKQEQRERAVIRRADAKMRAQLRAEKGAE